MIDPAQIPLVAIDSMNKIHLEEVEIINTLIGLLKNSECEDNIISETIDTLMEHMRLHFESENKRMQESHYGMYRLHRGEHDKILNEIRFKELEWRNRRDREAFNIYISEDLPAWLDQHIKAMDIVMADALN